ncbi:hypothetical protein NE237_004565 [Protea cynaroides]|uniref:Protein DETOXIFICATION n=1 Tax=Protea cynaroides TaxID=273540 RepID=A0A9Q0KJN9_9MAGN|nr:hypothetical protein NE237_004565 [Protea cynaroides]
MAQAQVQDIIEELPTVLEAQKVPLAVASDMTPPSTQETTTRVENKRNKIPAFVIFHNARSVFKKDELGMEILRIAIPAALALTADPIASLIDTAFIGRIGPVQLAAVGVAISVFNQVSRITVFPIASITTTAVAEDAVTFGILNSEKSEVENLEKEMATCKENELIPECNTEKIVGQSSSNTTGKLNMSKSKHRKRSIPSATSALIVSGILGLLQTLFLIMASKPLLRVMGLMRSVSVLTRKLIIVAGDLLNIILDPILMFVFHLGVTGAALAHCISQYIISLVLLWRLMKQIDIFAPSFKELQLGFLLLLRVVAVTFCVTLATSMAARLGTDPMAAFNICLQIWLTTSLLADGLAVGGQAILATAFAEKNYEMAKATAARVLQMSLVMGVGLAIFIGLGLMFGAEIFTTDKNVIHIIHIGVPFVAATQPLNTLAFVYDGVNYGASDYAFSAYSMDGIGNWTLEILKELAVVSFFG